VRLPRPRDTHPALLQRLLYMKMFLALRADQVQSHLFVFIFIFAWQKGYCYSAVTRLVAVTVSDVVVVVSWLGGSDFPVNASESLAFALLSLSSPLPSRVLSSVRLGASPRLLSPEAGLAGLRLALWGEKALVLSSVLREDALVPLKPLAPTAALLAADDTHDGVVRVQQR
jgi:hypothetical protein